MTKRDAAIAVTSAVVAGAVCYALAVTRPIRPPTPSQPFTATEKVAANDRVIMHVNGEPVTESEFLAFYRQLPPEVQQQYASEIGKETVGEQLIRMKLLEQEAHRLGVDRDPKVVARLKSDAANVLAGAAAEKLIGQPNEKAIREFYAKNRSRFETVDVSHILIAYSGGSLPARGGSSSPTLDSAKKRAAMVYDQLKAGADFAAMARKYSDDSTSAQAGGEIGQVSHGMLPGELDSTVFSTQPSHITAPLVSPFGIHIFRVNSRSTQPLEDMRAGITQRMRQQYLVDRVETLRKSAKVDFDPKFFTQKKKPS